MMIVYHAKKPTFGIEPHPVWPDEYEKVAEVEGDQLGLAFQLTNSIDMLWFKSKDPRLTVVGGSGRSTSVGDVVVTSDGVAHRCQTVGWSTIEEVKS